MAPPPKFSVDQEKELSKSQAAFAQELQQLDPQFNGSNTNLLTRWKKQEVQRLFGLEAFSMSKLNVQEANVTRVEWESRAMRKLTNSRRAAKVHTASANPSVLNNTAALDKVVNALVEFSCDISPMQTFERARKTDIKALAETLTAIDNKAQQYQAALKQLWALEDQAVWLAESQRTATISARQKEFPRVIFDALTCLCTSGKLGQLELMMHYAFRDAEDDIESGVLQVNSRPVGAPQFLGTIAEERGISMSHVLIYAVMVPYLSPELRPSALTTRITIAVNADGLPIFPQDLNLDSTAPDIVRTVLKDYIEAVWFFSCPLEKDSPSVPWGGLVDHPGNYLDVDKFSTPLPLAVPDAISSVHVLTLATYFLGLQTANTPFTFLSKETIERNVQARRLSEEKERQTGDEEDLQENTHPEEPKTMEQEEPQCEKELTPPPNPMSEVLDLNKKKAARKPRATRNPRSNSTAKQSILGFLPSGNGISRTRRRMDNFAAAADPESLSNSGAPKPRKRKRGNQAETSDNKSGKKKRKSKKTWCYVDENGDEVDENGNKVASD
ncbi:hypothetical protein C8J56DRAFT_1163915 [Mycena floridula]|nr:hypothetical protein C8J56DRAFT_1163915 [Mycena floridula]